MLSPNYSFYELLKKLEGRSYFETLKLADEEAQAANVAVRGRSIDRAKRAQDSNRATYADQVGALLFFLWNWKKPFSLTDEQFQDIRPLCQRWVDAKELLPGVLELFGPRIKKPSR